MNKDITKDIVNRFYQARLSNNVDQVMSFFCDTTQFNMAGESDDVYSSESLSLTNIRDQVEALVAAWEWLAVNDLIILSDGNLASTRYTLETIFRPTGEKIITQLSDHLELNEQGQVTRMTEFVDTALVQRLVAAASHREKQANEYYP